MMSSATSRLATLLLPLALTVACEGSTDSSYLRTDDAAVSTSWQPEMKTYRVTYQDEAAVVESLALDPSTRTVTDAELNRVSYTTDDGVIEVFYDEGVDRPFHGISYLRNSEFQARTWKDSSELKAKWEAGASLAADYISRLTKLTPVVWVGAGTDADYAEALTDGYVFMLTIDGWPVWVDDLTVTVDAEGLYEFHSGELAYDATANGTIACRTEAEIEAILGTGSAPMAIGFSPPIAYGFNTDTTTLIPMYLAVEQEEMHGYAIPLDRTVNE